MICIRKLKEKIKKKHIVIFMIGLTFYYLFIYTPTLYKHLEDIEETKGLNQVWILNFFSSRNMSKEAMERQHQKKEDTIEDENIKKLFHKINYNEDVRINRNKKTGEIHVYTTPDMHHHNIKIYDKDGTSLNDEFSFYTPYKAVMGTFDKKHYQVYMQIYEEAIFVGNIFQGYSKINIFIEYVFRNYF